MANFPNNSRNLTRVGPPGAPSQGRSYSGNSRRVPSTLNTPEPTGYIDSTDSSASSTSSSENGVAIPAHFEGFPSSSTPNYQEPSENSAAIPAHSEGFPSSSIVNHGPPVINPPASNVAVGFISNVTNEFESQFARGLGRQVSNMLLEQSPAVRIAALTARGIENAGRRVFNQRQINQQRSRRGLISQPGDLIRSGSGSMNTITDVNEPPGPITTPAATVENEKTKSETPPQNITSPRINGHQLLSSSYGHTGHNVITGSTSESSNSVDSNLSRTGSEGAIMNSQHITSSLPNYPEPVPNSRNNQLRSAPLDNEVMGYNIFNSRARAHAAAREAERVLRREMDAQDAAEVSQPTQSQTNEQVTVNSEILMPTMTDNQQNVNSSDTFSLNPAMQISAPLVPSLPLEEDAHPVFQLTPRGGLPHWPPRRFPPNANIPSTVPAVTPEPATQLSADAQLLNQEIAQVSLGTLTNPSTAFTSNLTPNQPYGSRDISDNQRIPTRSEQPDLSQPGTSLDPNQHATGENQQQATQANEVAQSANNGNQGGSITGDTATGIDGPIQAVQSTPHPTPPEEIDPPDQALLLEPKKIEARFVPNLGYHYNFRGHHVTLGPEFKLKYDFNSDFKFSPSIKINFNIEIAANKLCFEHKNGFGRSGLVGFRVLKGNKLLSVDLEKGKTGNVQFNHLRIGLDPNLSAAPIELVGVVDLKKGISMPHFVLRPTNSLNFHTFHLGEVPFTGQPIELKLGASPGLQFRLTRFTTTKLQFNKEPINSNSYNSNDHKNELNSHQLTTIVKLLRTTIEQNNNIEKNQQQETENSEINHERLAQALALNLRNTNNVGNITQTLVQSNGDETKDLLEQLTNASQECCDKTHGGLDNVGDQLNGVTDKLDDVYDITGALKNVLSASVLYQIANAATKSFVSITIYTGVTVFGVALYASVQRSIVICSKKDNLKPNLRAALIGLSLSLKAFSFLTCLLVVANSLYNIAFNKNFFSLCSLLKGTALSENGSLTSEEFFKNIKADSILTPSFTILGFVFTGMFAYGVAPIALGLVTNTMSIAARDRGIALVGYLVGLRLSRSLYSYILRNLEKEQLGREVFFQFVTKKIHGMKVIFVRVFVYVKGCITSVRVFTIVHNFFFEKPTNDK